VAGAVPFFLTLVHRARLGKAAAMATLIGGALSDASLVHLAQATEDALFGGSVVLFQPPRGAGYRTNVDALLLAGFAASQFPAAEALGAVVPARPRPASVAYDLGAGVGAVGLALLRLGGARHVVFVEIEDAPAALARRNLDANGWTHLGEVVRGDVRDVSRARRGDAALVVCNPPYIVPGRGRASPSEACARVGELGIFVEAARQVAGKRARVCFVYPASELASLLSELAAKGLYAKRMRLVHGTAKAPARIALVEARAGHCGGLLVMPPLFEREAGEYTPEMASLLDND
jgi:tRNA1Val (adenine37-N6)-methyltransferase